MKVKLLFLSEANLRERMFVQDFVHNFAFKQEKSILVLDAFGGTVRDTRFVTKRLSSLLSEVMVYNNAFMAGQRGLFVQETGKWQVRTDLISSLLKYIQVLLIGPVVGEGATASLISPIELVQAVRDNFEVDEILLFPKHAKSPLAAQKTWVKSTEDLKQLMNVYEEEADVLHLAAQLSPSRLVSPVNYAK
ncbi:MAG: hypothetical protein AAGI38_11225 [Bacteroidota bacterium]